MDHLGFLIDMDGVIYRGDKAIPEAIAFVEKIQDYPYLFLTNNSAVTPRSIKEKLSGIGVPRCEIEHILTSAMATADYLQGQKPGFTYYAVGGPGLLAALNAYGRKDENDPDFVVIGEGEGLDYDSLTIGINILLQGKARLIGTNPDVNLDGTRWGKQVTLPGGGALIAPFQAASCKEPLFIGKPNPAMYLQGLKRLNREAGEVFMIGDRPETDIKGAAEAGIRTILVTTGRYRRYDPYPADTPLPDFMVDSLAEMDLSQLQSMV